MNDIKIKFNIPFKGSLDNAVPVDISKRIPIAVTGESVTIPNTELGYINSVELQGNAIGGGGTPETPIAIQSVESPVALVNCGKNIRLGDYFVSYNTSYVKNSDNQITLTSTTNTNITKYTAVKLGNIPQGNYYLSFVKSENCENIIIYAQNALNTGNPIGGGVNAMAIKSFPTNGTLTIPSGYVAFYALFYLKAVTALGDTGVFSKLQLEKGSTATEYEPYQGTTLSIPLKDTNGNNITLRRAGTAYDSVYKENGKWYLRKVINEQTLNGSENWKVTEDRFYITDFAIKMPANTGTLANLLATTHQTKTMNQILAGDNGVYLAYGNFGIRDAVTFAGFTVADLKTWLSTHNITIAYELATPQIIELRSDTASALEKIITLNGTTNIIGTNTVNPIMIISANMVESAFGESSKPLRHELGKTISITETLPTQKLTLANFTNNAVNKNHYIYYSLPTVHNCTMGSQTASSVTAFGTNTTNSNFWQMTRQIPKGTTLTIKNNFAVLSGTQTPETGMIIVTRSDNIQSYGLAIGNGSTLTFTTLHSEPLRIWFYVDPESFVGEKIVNWNNIQLEQGYFPTEWQAHTDNNIFNMNGQINMRYDGAIMTGNTIENGALKSTYNFDEVYPCGQRISNLTIGKTYVLSFYLDGGTILSANAIVSLHNYNIASYSLVKEYTTKGFYSFTFTPTTTDILIGFGNRTGGTNYFRNIMLELAEPMEFTVCGKNLFDFAKPPSSISQSTDFTLLENGFRVQGTSSSAYSNANFDNILLEPNEKYTISALGNYSNESSAIIQLRNGIDNAFLTQFSLKDKNSHTISIPQSGVIKIWFVNGSDIPIGTFCEYTNIQLEKGSTATTYSPYQGTNYSIPLVDDLGNQIQMSQVDKVALDYASGKYRIAEMDLSTATQTALHGILCKNGTTTVSSANDITFETPYRFDGTQLGMYIWNLKSSATATTLGDYVGNAPITLYFDSIEPFDNATVYFDDATGMWATRAYCDGIAEDIRYNDDFRWDIKFDTSATSHTVTFTHWSVGDSEFRVNSVFPINGVFEIGHRYVDEVTSLSQSCIDNSKPTYGVLANTGLTQLRANEILNDLIMDSIIPTSGFDIEVYANGKQVQTHTAGESDYDAFSKTLSLNLTNKIDSVFNKNYYSYRLKAKYARVSDILAEIMATVGFTSQEVGHMVTNFGGNTNYGLFDKVYNTFITCPYISLGTTSQAINKICEIMQMQFIQKDNGDYRFINARPIYWQQDIQRIIKIPKKNQYVQFNTASAIPKNIITTVNAKVNKLNQGFGRISEEVKIVYYEGNTYVGNTKNNSVYQVSPISFDENGIGRVTSHIKIPINKKFLYNTDYIGDDGYNNRVIQIYYRYSYELYVDDETYFSLGEFTRPLNSSVNLGKATNIKVTSDLITFDYIDTVLVPSLSRTINKTFYVETISNWGTGCYLQPETVDYSKSGNGSNGTAISLPPNELINDVDGFQEVIADNILKDYATGILTAKTTINCDNYYKLNGDIAKDWEQGQIIEVGDIVRVDGDNIGTSASSYKDGTPRYWRVTGRKFRKSGVPRIDLELMEVKLTDESPL